MSACGAVLIATFEVWPRYWVLDSMDWSLRRPYHFLLASESWVLRFFKGIYKKQDSLSFKILCMGLHTYSARRTPDDGELEVGACQCQCEPELEFAPVCSIKLYQVLLHQGVSEECRTRRPQSPSEGSCRVTIGSTPANMDPACWNWLHYPLSDWTSTNTV